MTREIVRNKFFYEQKQVKAFDRWPFQGGIGGDMMSFNLLLEVVTRYSAVLYILYRMAWKSVSCTVCNNRIKSNFCDSDEPHY